MANGRPFDPSLAVPGEWQHHIDAATLRAGQRTALDTGRLQFQRDLIAKGKARFDPIMVTGDGVIVDGHHGARAAAEAGVSIDVLVVDLPVAAGLPIMQLPEV